MFITEHTSMTAESDMYIRKSRERGRIITIKKECIEVIGYARIIGQ